MKKLWFSLYDSSLLYKGDETEYFDARQFQWANELGEHTEGIYNELKVFIESNELPSHYSASMVSKKNSWKTIPLKTWSIEHTKNQKLFPFTYSLIKKYPEIISASFNLLEANSRIKPHCGDTNAIWRCHLGLEIPSVLPECGFKVREESLSWEKGKWIIFMDAYKHEAWNETNKNRYIFLIDVIRPEFIKKKKYVCSTVMTSLFLQRRMEKFHFINKLPSPLVNIIAHCLRPFSQLKIKMDNSFKIY